MPCKGEVAKYMDELSPASRIIGACNTIINKDGKLIGDITDGKGYVRNLKENGVDIKGKKVYNGCRWSCNCYTSSSCT